MSNQEINKNQETTNKNRNPIFIGIGIALLIIAILCAYVFRPDNTKVLFTYNGNKVTYQEAHVYARIQQYTAEEQYGSYLGSGMWKTKVGSNTKGEQMTLETSIKQSVIEQIKQVKVLGQKAKELNISLTKAEKEELNESMKEFAKSSTGKKVMKVTGADKAFIKKVYQENMLASKVQKKIMDKTKVSVSKEEATSVQVYKLFFPTTGQTKAKESAEKAYKEIKKGKNIEKVAKKYKVDAENEETYTTGKSQLGSEFEKAAKKLKKNEISGIVKVPTGYVIIKMLNPKDTSNLDSTKSTLLTEKQQAAYQKQYDQWTKKADKEWNDKTSINQKLWKKIKFKYVESTTTASETKSTTSSKTKTQN